MQGAIIKRLVVDKSRMMYIVRETSSSIMLNLAARFEKWPAFSGQDPFVHIYSTYK
jgi:hypothetical protein